jgi:hypothetical protein
MKRVSQDIAYGSQDMMYALQFKAFSLQRSLHTIQQTGANHAAAAIMDQHLMTAVLLHILAGLVLSALTEHEISRTIKIEIFHCICLL